jgi:cytochrome c oxidase subunit 2
MKFRPMIFLPLVGCGGPQSVLVPTGAEAQEIAWLFWTATAVSGAVLFLVSLLLLVALRGKPNRRRRLAQPHSVVVGGILLPVLVLTGLLVYGFHYLGDGYARGDGGATADITITGKRWWWQVIYHGRDGNLAVSANELRLPVGRPTVLHLESDNVIHSFWAAQLAGKLDMIPGRTNILTVTAREAGISRGQCAEFCGAAHALMSFHVVALPPEAFDAWLERESRPALPPQTDASVRGSAVFAANGCGACHRIRGTGAAGTIGPDLTHVGSRFSLGAATLPNDITAFMRWIADNQHVKPDNLMPDFRHLSAAELSDLAAYLDGLE